jgi:hypothetical protein
MQGYVEKTWERFILACELGVATTSNSPLSFIHWILLFSKPGAPGCYNMKNEQALNFVYDLARQSHEHSVIRREYGTGPWVGLQWFRYFRVVWQSLEDDCQKGMWLYIYENIIACAQEVSWEMCINNWQSYWICWCVTWYMQWHWAWRH